MASFLTKEIEDCLAHAAHCARQAKDTTSPGIREDFLRLEQNWRLLARSYEIARQIAADGINSDAHRPRPD
jgi:hypothetical protein